MQFNTKHPKPINTRTASPVPVGFCQCGCGGMTSLAKQSKIREYGVSVKGEPLLFLRGHSTKKNLAFDPDRSFWPRVDKSRDCWEWQGSKNKKGYGVIRVNSDCVSVHRLSWTLCFGEIESCLHVLHKCDNPGCVNPSHLFLGTHTDNMIDRSIKGRCNILKGAASPRAKLTWEQVARIRSDPRPSAALAKEYGVSSTTIKDIRRCQIYKTGEDA